MTSDVTHGIVILGGGLAAVRAAQTLRSLDYTGRVRIFTDEAHLPYDRPPLSKDCLTDSVDVSLLTLLSTQAIDDLDVEITTNATAITLDRARRQVAFAGGWSTGYTQLIVATGARARRLPGLVPSARIHYLRTVDDAQRLGQALRDAQRLVVVGSGFVGLEVASSARQLGLDVHVVAAEPGPMATVIGRQLSTWLAGMHRAHGVRLTNGVTVAHVEESVGGVGLITSDNAKLTADVVLVGAGISRDTDWLARAGLEIDGGLVCDRQGRTSDPSVFGAGDVVRIRDGEGGELIGHWTAAGESARRAAHAAIGAAPPADRGDSFFWTEQHGHRLQFIGRADTDADVHVHEGTIDSGAFVAELKSGSTVTGVFASNSPRAFVKRRLAFQKTTEHATL